MEITGKYAFSFILQPTSRLEFCGIVTKQMSEKNEMWEQKHEDERKRLGQGK